MRSARSIIDLVVFDHEQRVALVAERFERADEALVVARMQADGRFIEHIEHAGKVGSELRGEADPLGLAAGKGFRGALQREIAEADVVEELQALLDLWNDVHRDRPPAGIEGELAKAGQEAGGRQAAAARAARAAARSGSAV